MKNRTNEQRHQAEDPEDHHILGVLGQVFLYYIRAGGNEISKQELFDTLPDRAERFQLREKEEENGRHGNERQQAGIGESARAKQAVIVEELLERMDGHSNGVNEDSRP